MTEVENLVLDHPGRFQAQLARFEEKPNEVAADMQGMKQPLAAFMAPEANQDGRRRASASAGAHRAAVRSDRQRGTEMLGAILAGAALGAASLIILNGRKAPQAAPVRVKSKDRTHAEHR